MSEQIELKIYNQEDRLAVASILVKNGYTVSQKKRVVRPNSKTVRYYLSAVLDEENASTAK